MKHKLNPVLDAQLNRNRARRMGHRRNLSDGGHVGEDVSIHDLIILLVASTIHHHGKIFYKLSKNLLNISPCCHHFINED